MKNLVIYNRALSETELVELASQTCGDDIVLGCSKWLQSCFILQIKTVIPRLKQLYFFWSIYNVLEVYVLSNKCNMFTTMHVWYFYHCQWDLLATGLWTASVGFHLLLKSKVDMMVFCMEVYLCSRSSQALMGKYSRLWPLRLLQKKCPRSMKHSYFHPFPLYLYQSSQLRQYRI